MAFGISDIKRYFLNLKNICHHKSKNISTEICHN